MKKLAIVVGVLFLVTAIGAYFYFSGEEYEIRLSEEKIHEMLAAKLPTSRTYLFIIQVTLDNPRVLLENGSSRINAGMDVSLNIALSDNPDPLGGSIDVSGGVRYEADKGQFFLTDPVVA